jgi:hypothetical protein
MRVLKGSTSPASAAASLEAEITAPKDTYRAEPLPEGPVATNARLRTCGLRH